MRKKDKFFVCIFIISFLVCSAVIMTDYPQKQLTDITQEANGTIEKTEDDEYIEEAISEIISSDNQEVSNDGQSNNINPAESETPETKETITFETVGYEYFDDALFIGDSRTVGIMEYGNIENATFFADTGMSVFNLKSKKIEIPELGKVKFDEILESRQFEKIYLMLGINELGYRFENIEQKYQETLENIRTAQNDAIIYLCANLHVTEEQSQNDSNYNNENINRLNNTIKELADNESIFYIDVNEIFDDDHGNLNTEYSSDGFHVYATGYKKWVDWLCTKAVNPTFNSDKYY